MLRSAWDQCHDAEVILESPYAFAGVHIAEALCMCFSLSLENYFVTRKMNLNSSIATAIPYFRVCTMPWSKTTQFPHPFISPPVETSKFNSISYVLYQSPRVSIVNPIINIADMFSLITSSGSLPHLRSTSGVKRSLVSTLPTCRIHCKPRFQSYIISPR